MIAIATSKITPAKTRSVSLLENGNVELSFWSTVKVASPQDFLPPLSRWRNRRLGLGKTRSLSFHPMISLPKQLLSYPEDCDRNVYEVRARCEQRLFPLEVLQNYSATIKPKSVFFAVDRDAEEKITAFIEQAL
ncbi:MAG: hypothetical protein AAF609_01065 [Cyanobacteria bacterium P01_C01_bin.120]